MKSITQDMIDQIITKVLVAREDMALTWTTNKPFYKLLKMSAAPENIQSRLSFVCIVRYDTKAAKIRKLWAQAHKEHRARANAKTEEKKKDTTMSNPEKMFLTGVKDV